MSRLQYIRLNDGRAIPALAFGTGGIPHDVTVGRVNQSLDVGFEHIDTAQRYGNEEQVGQSLRESGLKRDEVWITTKYSGAEPGIRATFEQSLKKLGVSYVDLYLIHSPLFVKGNIPGAWKELETLKKEGLAKSIGVSNFEIEDLTILLANAEIRPAVNQILFHPSVYGKQKELIAFQTQHDIVIEAYSALTPLRKQPGGSVDTTVSSIAKRLSVEPEQVLLSWVHAKGAVIVTSSSNKERLEGYLAIGNIKLTEDDIKSIDAAGQE